MNDSQVKKSSSTGLDEMPMAVYPLNSSAKLDQEPNPFEQSFSGIAKEEKGKLKLPPVASITSTTKGVLAGGVLPKEVANQFTWETLRTGPLSPSMLQGPIHSDDYYYHSQVLGNSGHSTSNKNETIKLNQDSRSSRSRQSSNSSMNDRKRSIEDDNYSLDSQDYHHKRKTSNSSEDDQFYQIKKKNNNSNDEDEKRKDFLERNRIAALKCRQRKKQWLNDLQSKVECLSTDNERLQSQSEALKEEIVNLKTLLLAHKECPVAQSNGFNPNLIQKKSHLDFNTLSFQSYFKPKQKYQHTHMNLTSQSSQPNIMSSSSSGVLRF